MHLPLVVFGLAMMLAGVLAPSPAGPVLLAGGLLAVAAGAIAGGPGDGTSANANDQLETEEELLFVHGEDD